MPVVPNKDFNLFLNGGDPKKTPSIGVDDLSASSAGYGNVTVPIPPVIMPQSSIVFDSRMGGNSSDFQYVDSPESTQVINNQQSVVPPTNIYQETIQNILKNNQNNGKLINQSVDPVFDYIRQQQANSIYPDLGNTTSADYYPSSGVMSTSTSDPMYGSFNQYATQSLTPYAIYDKRNSALQKAAAASLPSGMTNKIPDAYVSYAGEVGEKTFTTTQNAIKEVHNAGYGKYGYEILEKGIGEIGQRYQRDIANINTIAKQTKDVGDLTDNLYKMQSEGKYVSPDALNLAKDFRKGALDLWGGKGTDKDLGNIVSKLESYPAMVTTINDYLSKVSPDEWTVFAKTAEDRGYIGENKIFKKSDIKQLTDDKAKVIAHDIFMTTGGQGRTESEIKDLLQDIMGTQIKDSWDKINTHVPREKGDGSGSGSGGDNKNNLKWVVDDTVNAVVKSTGLETKDGKGVVNGHLTNLLDSFMFPMTSKGATTLQPLYGLWESGGKYYPVTKSQYNPNTGKFATADVLANGEIRGDLWNGFIVPAMTQKYKGSSAEKVQKLRDYVEQDAEKCKVFGLPYTTSDGHTVKWNGTQWVKI